MLPETRKALRQVQKTETDPGGLWWIRRMLRGEAEAAPMRRKKKKRHRPRKAAR